MLPALLLLPGAAAVPSPDDSDGIRIDELLPWSPPGAGREYISLSNTGAGAVDLAGWGITMPAGRLLLDGLVVPGRDSIVLAENATAYRAATGGWPDRPGPVAGEAEGWPNLPNRGGGVVVTRPDGSIVDAVCYGIVPEGGCPEWNGPPVPAPREDEVLRQSSTGVPRTAAAWRQDRPLRIGQSLFPTASAPLEAAAARAFIAPDSSLAEVGAALASAEQEILLNGYALTSLPVVEALRGAAARGVRVVVLIEGRPVGGLRDDHEENLHRLAAGGVEVRLLDGPDGAARPYRYDHAKYAVIDRERLLVMTENWSPGGLPSDGRGNRGWGILVRSAAIAEAGRSVFLHDSDLSLGAVRAIEADSAAALSPPGASEDPIADPRARPQAGAFLSTGPARVTLLVGPEQSLAEAGILGVVRGARRTVDVELLQSDARWDDGPNPFLASLLDAARRGVTVRILLEGRFADPADPAMDTADAAAYLRHHARRERLPLDVVLLTSVQQAPGLIHTKGLVADGRVVVLGSMNWAEGSAQLNREIGVRVDSPEVAGFFAGWFARDWAAAGGDPATWGPAVPADPAGHAGWRWDAAPAALLLICLCRRVAGTQVRR